MSFNFYFSIVIDFNMSIQIKWILNRRPGNQEERTEVISTYAYDLPQNLSTDIADLLEANRSNVTISHLMPKFLKVTSVTPGAATAVPQLMTNNSKLNIPYLLIIRDEIKPRLIKSDFKEPTSE